MLFLGRIIRVACSLTQLWVICRFNKPNLSSFRQKIYRKAMYSRACTWAGSWLTLTPYSLSLWEWITAKDQNSTGGFLESSPGFIQRVSLPGFGETMPKPGWSQTAAHLELLSLPQSLLLVCFKEKVGPLGMACSWQIRAGCFSSLGPITCSRELKLSWLVCDSLFCW